MEKIHPSITHGFTKGRQRPRFYRIWEAVRRRCTNPNQDNYKYYGGRGIKVEWNSFLEFRDDMYQEYLEHVEKFGEKNTSIDRIDINENYCKENCRWATLKDQTRNTKRNRFIEFRNESRCVSEWAEIFGLQSDTVLYRLNKGWGIEKSLITPTKKY